MKKVILALAIVFSMSSFTTDSKEIVLNQSCFDLGVNAYDASGVDSDQAEGLAMGWISSCEVSRYLLGIEY